MAAVQSQSTLLGLQKVELFRGLDSYSLREIAAQCKWTRCRRNEYVMRREDIGRDVYLVIAGTLRITAAAGRGRRIILDDVGAGGIFGEHSALDGRGPLADVRALRESLVGSIPGEVFRSIVASHASVRERLLQRLTGSLRELTDRLLELGAQPVQRRIRIELLRRARIAGVEANRCCLDPAPTHYEVASRIGTAREQVTRELSCLVRQGVLERAGRALVLRDIAALEQLAAEAAFD
jgi:CRP-like cAMP-binding protein